MSGLNNAQSLAFGAINPLQVQMLARSIKRFEFLFDGFDEPLLYPDASTQPGRVADFFFFLVAIDHRTHSPGITYRGRVDGVELTGAELMYALAKKRFDADATFFTASHISKISTKEVTSLFRVTDPQIIDIAGPDDRAGLLRDCGLKLRRDFGGSFLNVISKSGGYLLGPEGNGLLQLLKRFNAYQDSLSKKSFLLVKFLERRHLLLLKDPENLHVPVDNILQRLALRTGIITVTDEELDRKIRYDAAVGSAEVEAIRRMTMQAFDEVAKAAFMNALYLDDILWEFGRAHCRVPIPLCDSLPNSESRRPYRIIKSGPVGECPFGPGCQGYRDTARWELKEPNFKTTFY